MAWTLPNYHGGESSCLNMRAGAIEHDVAPYALPVNRGLWRGERYAMVRIEQATKTLESGGVVMPYQTYDVENEDYLIGKLDELTDEQRAMVEAHRGADAHAAGFVINAYGIVTYAEKSAPVLSENDIGAQRLQTSQDSTGTPQSAHTPVATPIAGRDSTEGVMRARYADTPETRLMEQRTKESLAECNDLPMRAFLPIEGVWKVSDGDGESVALRWGAIELRYPIAREREGDSESPYIVSDTPELHALLSGRRGEMTSLGFLSDTGSDGTVTVTWDGTEGDSAWAAFSPEQVRQKGEDLLVMMPNCSDVLQLKLQEPTAYPIAGVLAFQRDTATLSALSSLDALRSERSVELSHMLGIDCHRLEFHRYRLHRARTALASTPSGEALSERWCHRWQEWWDSSLVALREAHGAYLEADSMTVSEEELPALAKAEEARQALIVLRHVIGTVEMPSNADAEIHPPLFPSQYGLGGQS